MTDHDLPTRTEGEGETLDMPEGLGTFTSGQVLGERYQILEMLGRGGMGEVWHAFDLKLRVEVALKALREDLFKSESRLELLRQEVRAAREVVSPNVCRIFDLEEEDGRELISMEYVDGATLLGVLQERGPLELKEAQDIASQFLAGLEAIHKVGLVHRDIKPENIMLTRAGRVVVMDFGLARQETEGGGSVSGTPAYMAPEQAAGQTLDPRADVYSAGVVLAEMVSPEGIKNIESRQSVWEGVRSEPAKVPETPWADVIKKAVTKDRERRFNTAHTLTRALEDVTLRVEGADDLHPYPGLASFTESDAEYFFGREAEVEQMWRKLEGPTRLLALVGPSGAGKTSFLRAGLMPGAGAGWAIVRCTPGTSPMTALREALVSQMSGDTDAIKELVRVEDRSGMVSAAARWRRRHDHAVIIVDQFEELMTLNASEIQTEFASVLHELVLQSDIFVLLSMRDDFLMACNRHEALRPIVSDLTLLDPPTGANLRRALVQPAMKCGYRLEDDELVEKMLAEVEGERGALPLLAFAAARLWEMRDRETGLLTRQAYEDIGGVGGALARHAEATVDRIGSEHIGIVRELFRNLITAEGTRAVREWNELLSVFGGDPNTQTNVGAGFTPARDTAEEVLRELIDARLLTSYEVREDEHEPIRRIEIIHESLLANWPRLVRWQTQDQEGAQIRDELRQSARSWDEHGRHADRLWTGTAFREYQLWRERYPGGLTETEDSFASAMTSFANRRRRRRRIVVAAGVAVLLVVLAIVTGLWRQSVRQTRLAEAQKLLALGQLEIDRFPTAALAWAKASLGVADTPEGRLFALKAIANGPIGRALELDTETHGVVHGVSFSPDGRLAALNGYEILKIQKQSGGLPTVVAEFPTNRFATFSPIFEASGSRLGVWRTHGGSRRATEIRTFEVPGFAEVSRIDVEFGEGYFDFRPTERGFFLMYRVAGEVEIRHVPFGADERVFDRIEDFRAYYFDPRGKWMACQRENTVFLHSLEIPNTPPRELGRLDRPYARLRVDPDLDWVATVETGASTASVWPLGDVENSAARILDADGPAIGDFGSWQIDSQGNKVAISAVVDGGSLSRVWDLRLPRDAEPLVIRDPDAVYNNSIKFDPSGRWAVTGNVSRVGFWPVAGGGPMVFETGSGMIFGLAFTLDSGAVAVTAWSGGIRLLPIRGDASVREVWESRRPTTAVEVDSHGDFILFSEMPASVIMLPLDGSEPGRFEGFGDAAMVAPVAYDPERELIAAGVYRGPRDEKVIRVWNLRDGSVKVLGPADDAGDGFVGGYRGLEFLPDGRLLSAGKGGVRFWDLEDGSSELIFSETCWRMDLSPDKHTVAVLLGNPQPIGPVVLIDLGTSEARELTSFGISNSCLSFGPQPDLFATGRPDGTIRVGRISDREHHLLFGHDTFVSAVAFSPDGRWLASADNNGTVRVWPVPDLSKLPPHTLPHDELLAKLDSFTNFRVVQDEASSTGWKLEIGPFPGWETVPEW